MASISYKRLAVYFAATDSNIEALALYELNTRLSCCLFESISSFEVVLRNAVSEAIIDHFGQENWFHARAFASLLTPERRQNLQDACDKMKEQDRDMESGRIIAELSFHFWTALHEPKYRKTIWTPFLRKIWPDGENIRKVHKDLLKVKELRNRIAHHEPVFAAKWRDRAPLIGQRLHQLSPQHHAWLTHRIEPTLDCLISDLNLLDRMHGVTIELKK